MIKTNYAIIGSILPALIITWYASNMIDEHSESYRELQEQLFECQNNTNGYDSFRTHVTLTMYNPTRGQTDSTPNITADGTRINIWKASTYRYVAVSRDLLKRWGGPLDYGDWIIIEGAGKDSGVYQIRDTMNPKWTKRVDVLKTPGSRKFKYDNVVLTKYDSLEEANYTYFGD